MPTTGYGDEAGRKSVAHDGALVFPREETLLKAGALQDAIFNSANFSSIATDERGVIQIFNVGAERMLGYAASEVVNQVTPADISDPQEVIAHAEALSIELGTPITAGFEALVFKASRGIEDIYELTYIRKDGSRFPAIVSVTALRDAEDAIIGYLLIGTDNTARKQVEADQALQERNIELEHANRMKSEFLATMSHELRTPLNAIIGFSEALKDNMIGPMSESQQEYIGDIFTSGQHLLSLINDILDLSKVEAGMMGLDLEAVNLNDLLSNSLSIVKEQAAAQRIRLELETDKGPGLPLLLLDIRKTKQIVYNLLSNAVKFSSNGGQVTLSVRRVPRSAVGKLSDVWPVHSLPLADNEYEEFVEISVTDSGIGISIVNMAKLFRAFSQIDSRLARKFEGTGLGLAMVKQMTELHGGAVAVTSAEGKGARFAAWLPLRPLGQTASSLPQATTRHAADTTERIALVVEGNDRSAESIRLLLEAEGLTVLHAASAEAALLLAPLQPLQLITLNIELPGADGWDFLMRLSESSTLSRVPVVISSGVVDSPWALTGGKAAVVQKPISRGQLTFSLANLGLSPERGRAHTVLVVDDDPKAVEVIAALLPSPNYVVVRAYGGMEAVTTALRLRPDVIFLDLMMPEVNGFDVVEALKCHTETASIPILVVTAKQVTALDRTALNSNSDRDTPIAESSSVNRVSFIAEVRQALITN